MEVSNINIHGTSIWNKSVPLVWNILYHQSRTWVSSGSRYTTLKIAWIVVKFIEAVNKLPNVLRKQLGKRDTPIIYSTYYIHEVDQVWLLKCFRKGTCFLQIIQERRNTCLNNEVRGDIVPVSWLESCWKTVSNCKPEVDMRKAPLAVFEHTGPSLSS